VGNGLAQDERTHLWRPFHHTNIAAPLPCLSGIYTKISPATSWSFEEINHDLGLNPARRLAHRRPLWLRPHRAGWRITASGRARLICSTVCKTYCLTGPTVALQATMSSLLHAYKRSELDKESGLGIFALSATLSDRAEPSESLKATVAWQVGLDNPLYLLSAAQMAAFGNGRSLTPEHDICGKPGVLSGQQHFYPGTPAQTATGTTWPTSTRTVRPLPVWPAS
jgi:hypothetical protein